MPWAHRSLELVAAVHMDSLAPGQCLGNQVRIGPQPGAVHTSSAESDAPETMTAVLVRWGQMVNLVLKQLRSDQSVMAEEPSG
jgi:hypothetical protein